jgi:hypothetical protein
VAAWERQRNARQARIHWTFTLAAAWMPYKSENRNLGTIERRGGLAGLLVRSWCVQVFAPGARLSGRGCHPPPAGDAAARPSWGGPNLELQGGSGMRCRTLRAGDLRPAPGPSPGSGRPLPARPGPPYRRKKAAGAGTGTFYGIRQRTGRCQSPRADPAEDSVHRASLSPVFLPPIRLPCRPGGASSEEPCHAVETPADRKKDTGAPTWAGGVRHARPGRRGHNVLMI